MTACPSCGAALRPGSPWCTLCYHDLRPPKPVQATQPIQPAVQPTTAPPNAAYGPVAKDPLTQPLIDFLPAAGPAVPVPRLSPVDPAAVTWPCSACGCNNPLAATTCAGCGSAFLAAVRVRPSLVLPIVGDLGRLSRAQRIWGALGVAMAVIITIALISLALAHRAPQADLTPVTVVTSTDQPSASPTATAFPTP